MPRLNYIKMTFEDHKKVTRNVPFYPIQSLLCDSCGKPIKGRKLKTQTVKTKQNYQWCNDRCLKIFTDIDSKKYKMLFLKGGIK